MFDRFPDKQGGWADPACMIDFADEQGLGGLCLYHKPAPPTCPGNQPLVLNFGIRSNFNFSVWSLWGLRF